MNRKIKTIILLYLIVAPFLFAEVRIKDVTRIEGIEETQLIGYGLIVGLNNSGDGTRTMFTVHSIVNMLRNLGITIPDYQLRVKNVAAVIVTGKMVPFMKRGAKLDVSVSSIGDAKSLEGGMLLMTPLKGVDDEIYAIAQGAISIGGYNIESTKGTKRRKNHALAGEVPFGAIVKREVHSNRLDDKLVSFSLDTPDFSSAVAMTRAINGKFSMNIAKTLDAATIEVKVPTQFNGQTISFIAAMEQITFEPNIKAKIILNEKTGTIVVGNNVAISQVAVSHGNITVKVDSSTKVVQPQALTAGVGTKTPVVKTEVAEEKPQMVVLPASGNAGDLAKALNDIGLSPRDVIAIFQAIKRSGALHAELVLM